MTCLSCLLLSATVAQYIERIRPGIGLGWFDLCAERRDERFSNELIARNVLELQGMNVCVCIELASTMEWLFILFRFCGFGIISDNSFIWHRVVLNVSVSSTCPFPIGQFNPIPHQKMTQDYCSSPWPTHYTHVLPSYHHDHQNHKKTNTRLSSARAISYSL